VVHITSPNQAATAHSKCAQTQEKFLPKESQIKFCEILPQFRRQYNESILSRNSASVFVQGCGAASFLCDSGSGSETEKLNGQGSDPFYILQDGANFFKKNYAF
jgi:hypothetical protein